MDMPSDPMHAEAVYALYLTPAQLPQRHGRAAGQLRGQRPRAASCSASTDGTACTLTCRNTCRNTRCNTRESVKHLHGTCMAPAWRLTMHPLHVCGAPRLSLMLSLVLNHAAPVSCVGGVIPCPLVHPAPAPRMLIATPPSAQVCATSATILAGLEKVAVWRLKQAHLPPAPQAPAVLSACHAQHYLLLRLNNGSVVLLRQARDEAALEVVPGSPAATFVDPGERPDLHITASCLYHDLSGWLTATLHLSQPDTVRSPCCGPD